MTSEEEWRKTLIRYYKTIASTKFERSLDKTNTGWLVEREFGHAMITPHDHVQIAVARIEN